MLLGDYVMQFGWSADVCVSLGNGQASLSRAVEEGDTDLIELKEGQGRLRDVMERRFDDIERRFERLEDILRGQETPD